MHKKKQMHNFKSTREVNVTMRIVKKYRISTADI